VTTIDLRTADVPVASATTRVRERRGRHIARISWLAYWSTLLVSVTLATLGILAIRAYEGAHESNVTSDLSAENDYLLSVLLVIVLVLIQVPVTLWLIRRVQSQHIEQRRLLRRASDASQTERSRVARDLHDMVIPDLAAVCFSVQAASTIAESDAAAAVQLLDQAQATLLSDIASLRSMLIELTPSTTSDSAHESISLLALSIPHEGMAISLDIPQDLDLDCRVTESIHRIVREAVRNSVSHSCATTIWIRVRREGDTVHVVITDDGRGFDTSRSSSAGHLGLSLLSDAASDLGGSVHVTSEIGRGTQVSATMRATS